MQQNPLDSPIQFLKGVGPKRGELLKKELGITTYNDLLTFYPFRYVDRSKFYKINEIRSDIPYIQIKGKVISMDSKGKQRGKRLVALFKDDTGIIELVWFRGVRWIQNSIKPGVEYVLFGKPNIYNGRINIPHPEMDLVSEENLRPLNSLQAVYSSTEKLSSQGLNSRGIAKLQGELLSSIYNSLYEVLPKDLCTKNGLLLRRDALINIHLPKTQELLKQAVYRIKYEELFFIQLKILQSKEHRKITTLGFKFTKVGDYFNNFYKNGLSFDLTNAQKRVIKEIRNDLGSGRQMNRLLQGDVGSGKTIVAFMNILIALDNSLQACIMAPTEILANQHFESIRHMLDKLNIKSGILTGSTKTSERKVLLEELSNGELKVVIGTHALIGDKVVFKDLGLVIIDEQHRFGVEQRSKLWKKNNTCPPHILVMTATPIPRTLAMTVYGDLDVSIIDELPPGRKPVKTIHRFDSSRLKVFGFMKDQIKCGRQIYMVYPLIEESEKMDYKDLMDGYESIVRAFPKPHYQISIVHGKMNAEAKNFEMQRFIKGETQIMVATNVIEVGVDVPNATVMVIESAERFGLSQLHQLRGRVGRGSSQSYCIIMTGNKLTDVGKIRMETMTKTNDGFEIAEVDLNIRGPGDMEGTQQSGALNFKLVDLCKDGQIIQMARKQVMELLKFDPSLEDEQNRRTVKHLNYLYKHTKDWSKIS
ncbi:MAG TPA: ATP-dependent DNA helicase RecG [Flavobacteriales bacterium]|nr:ATP-dependent DNA helicase RecG [Flavobacteriales bacterium]